jgi:hypothetical protein
MHARLYILFFLVSFISQVQAKQKKPPHPSHDPFAACTVIGERHPTVPSSRTVPLPSSAAETFIVVSQYMKYFQDDYAASIKFHMDQLIKKLMGESDRTKRIIILDIDDTLLSSGLRKLSDDYQYLINTLLAGAAHITIPSVKDDDLYFPAVPLMADYVKTLRSLGYMLVIVTGRMYTHFHEMTALNLTTEGFGDFHNASWYFKHGLRSFTPPQDFLCDSIFHMPDRLARTTEAAAAWKKSVYDFLHEQGYIVEAWIDDMENNFACVDKSKTTTVHMPHPKNFPAYQSLIDTLKQLRRKSAL